MAPSHSRHLLVWTTLPIAVLLSYLWFKRKRVAAQSDPGRLNPTDQEEKSLQQELREVEATDRPSTSASPEKTFSRSLSGVDSAPIDIIFPPELKSVKSSQIIISDEDLDLEIEKIKSMKNSVEFYSKRRDTPSQSTPPQKSVESPKKEVSNHKVTLKQASPRKAAGAKKEGKTKKSDEINKSIPETSKKTEMDQNNIVTVSSVENKINSLKIEAKEPCTPQQNKVEATTATTVRQRQSSERDSANHSPADVMMTSPSPSSLSGSLSEGSSDSGKGCSEVATSPSQTPANAGSVSGDAGSVSGDAGSVSGDVLPLPIFYEFEICHRFVGRLIGKQRSYLKQLEDEAKVAICLKQPLFGNGNMRICCIEGSTQVDIDNALQLIRERFPEKRYPTLSLKPVCQVPFLPVHYLSVKLVENITNDTMVSCMVSPNHLFLQQPTHPSFPHLNTLSSCMNMNYADPNSPLLPNLIAEHSICAAFSIGAWYRALVLSTDTETEMSYVKFLDYGGFANIKNSDLRQIRGDFIELPFQAAECLLSNVKPVGGDGAEWSDGAFKLVAERTKGAIIFTHVAGYTEDHIPLVHIYVPVPGIGVEFLNGELVSSGFAEWIVQVPQVAKEGAVGSGVSA